MLPGKTSKTIETYFKRFASPEPILPDSIGTDCKMIIVIPCYNEPDLMGTLISLTQCYPPNCTVEVIIVVNQSISANEEVNQKNIQTVREFDNWVKQHSDTDRMSFLCIKLLDMPKKHAGVGLARKAGMDEALRRFVHNGMDGTIICLDADCRVSENYLRAIESQFAEQSAGLGEVYYEHPFEKEKTPSLRSGIVNYELFLRYYVEGLRQAGFPNSIHTVGSCMLVKASVYAKHGGMNKKKAGEDFYFLHKIVPHEEFTTVTEAIVFPSCRTSDRVPFGTGKAQQDWLDKEEKSYLTYDPQIFNELKVVLESVASFFTKSIDEVLGGFNSICRAFFTEHDYSSKIRLIKDNCSTMAQFQKQFFIWFDGFLCMKFVHFLRDRSYPNIPISLAAAVLISSKEENEEKLLEAYRSIDRQ